MMDVVFHLGRGIFFSLARSLDVKGRTWTNDQNVGQEVVKWNLAVYIGLLERF
jgi:hypothetical protein